MAMALQANIAKHLRGVIVFEKIAGIDVNKAFENYKGTNLNNIERLEKKINEVDIKVENLGHKVNQIDRRLFSIEEDVAEIKTKKHKELDKRVTFIEQKLGIEGAR